MADLRLTLGRRPVRTVFDLLGHQEDDLTYSLGWGLASSPALVEAVGAAAGLRKAGEPLAIGLQQPAASGGFTDVELRFAHAHLILEAKRGWSLPGRAQLTRYRQRFDPSLEAVLLVLSEASHEFAARRLPADVDGVPVRYLPWAQIIQLSDECSRHIHGHAERRLVRELTRYLRGAVRMQDLFSTWTYCVSVSNTTPAGWSMSFRDAVNRGFYFHPFGNGWLRTAPAFLALRWANAVQRIHHIDAYEVADTLHDRFPEIPATAETDRPHLIYTLGHNLGPSAPLPAGTTYRAARMWVALDLLLTSPTLKDALAATKRRAYQQGFDANAA